MSAPRRMTCLLAALAATGGGSFLLAAQADAETAERRGAPALSLAASGPAGAHRHANALAGALGVSQEWLGVVLRELRAERRATDVAGARPPVRDAPERARERADYVRALAAKVGVTPSVAAAALAGVAPPPAAGTGSG
jgi:hypothetical protein